MECWVIVASAGSMEHISPCPELVPHRSARPLPLVVSMGPRRAVPASVTPPQQSSTPYDSDDPTFAADTPAVLISPVKARKRRQDIASKSDKDVWNLRDQEIIGVSLYSLYKLIFTDFTKN